MRSSELTDLVHYEPSLNSLPEPNIHPQQYAGRSSDYDLLH